MQLSLEARRASVFFFQTPTRSPASVQPIKSAGVNVRGRAEEDGFTAARAVCLVCDRIPQALKVHLREFQGIFGTETKAASV